MQVQGGVRQLLGFGPISRLISPPWSHIPLLLTMAAEEAISWLVDPVRNLVLAASVVYGTSEKDAAEVTLWIEKIAKKDVLGEEDIKVDTLLLHM